MPRTSRCAATRRRNSSTVTTVTLAKNDRLKRAMASRMSRAKDQCEETGETVRPYDEFRYETLDTWSKK